MSELNRRDFLGRAVLLAGAVPFAPSLFPFAHTRDTAPAAGYRSLTLTEATFTEAMVNALCPADSLTPDGVTCGLATFIDRQLAGDFGAQPASQLPLSNREFFRNGVAAADAASRQRFGMPFAQLDAIAAGAFLAGIASGRVQAEGLSLGAWHKQVVDPLLVQACFSGPIYEKYDNSVFSKLFG